MRENKKADTVLCLLSLFFSRTSNLNLLLLLSYYCFARQHSAGDDKTKWANSNTLSCKWKTILHNRLKAPALCPLSSSPYSSLPPPTLKAYILYCDTNTSTVIAFFVSLMCLTEIGHSFSCSFNTTSNLRNWCPKQLMWLTSTSSRFVGKKKIFFNQTNATVYMSHLWLWNYWGCSSTTVV